MHKSNPKERQAYKHKAMQFSSANREKRKTYSKVINFTVLSVDLALTTTAFYWENFASTTEKFVPKKKTMNKSPFFFFITLAYVRLRWCESLESVYEESELNFLCTQPSNNSRIEKKQLKVIDIEFFLVQLFSFVYRRRCWCFSCHSAIIYWWLNFFVDCVFPKLWLLTAAVDPISRLFKQHHRCCLRCAISTSFIGLHVN